MAYSAPSGDAVTFQFPEEAYSAPAGNALAFSFQPPPISAAATFAFSPQAEGSGSFFERIQGWLDASFAFGVEALGAIYPFGSGEILAAISVSGVGDLAVRGDSSYGLDIQVVSAGAINSLGAAFLLIPPSVSVEAVYTSPIRFQPGVSAVGQVTVPGAGQVALPLHPAGVGSVGRSGHAEIAVAAAARGLGGHGVSGVGGLAVLPVVGSWGGHLPRVEGGGSCAVGLAASLIGEVWIEIPAIGQVFIRPVQEALSVFE